jgi:hypothetical protein
METTIDTVTASDIAGSIRRTIQVTEFLEKNQIKKQAKLNALRLAASDLSGTLFRNNEDAKHDFLKTCGLTE